MREDGSSEGTDRDETGKQNEGQVPAPEKSADDGKEEIKHLLD
jgi:hypothetical protein